MEKNEFDKKVRKPLSEIRMIWNKHLSGDTFDITTKLLSLNNTQTIESFSLNHVMNNHRKRVDGKNTNH